MLAFLNRSRRTVSITLLATCGVAGSAAAAQFQPGTYTGNTSQVATFGYLKASHGHITLTGITNTAAVAKISPSFYLQIRCDGPGIAATGGEFWLGAQLSNMFRVNVNGRFGGVFVYTSQVMNDNTGAQMPLKERGTLHGLVKNAHLITGSFQVTSRLYEHGHLYTTCVSPTITYSARRH